MYTHHFRVYTHRSPIWVERLQEIIDLTLELEEDIPEEIGLAIQELVEEVVRLQLRVADLVRFIETEGNEGNHA